MRAMQQWIWALLIAAIIGGAPAAAQTFASAPTWCPRAGTEVERAICRWEALWELDHRLNSLYRTARDNGDGEGQRDWLRSRDRCGADSSCLRRSYEERIAILEDRVGRPGRLSTTAFLSESVRDCGHLAPDDVRTLSASGAGSAAVRCAITVEPNALAIVTLGRISGDAELDLVVAENAPSPAQVEGVIGSSDAPDATMDLVVIPPSSERRRFEVLAHQVGAGSGAYQIRFNSRPLAEPVLKGLVLAGGHMLFEAFANSFLGLPYDPQSSRDRNLDRAMTIGLSSLMRENPYQMGLDFAMNEARLQVERAFPNDRELQIVVFQVIGQVVQVIARDATRIQTLRDQN